MTMPVPATGADQIRHRLDGLAKPQCRQRCALPDTSAPHSRHL